MICFRFCSSVNIQLEAGKCVKVNVKISDDLGELELGKLDQEYIKDPDLRELLDMAALDVKRMESLEDQKLRLIYSVIYSEKFVLKGQRDHEVFISVVNCEYQCYDERMNEFVECIHYGHTKQGFLKSGSESIKLYSLAYICYTTCFEIGRFQNVVRPR